MTGEELLKLVDLACGLWNIDATKQRKTEMREAWKLMLHDLDFDPCRQAVADLSITETFMPRPAQVRRMVLAPPNAIPSPLEAWTQFQGLLKGAASGAGLTDVVHPAVQQAIRRIGGGYGMHTNGDRDAFIDTYKKVVAEMETEMYSVRDK